MIRSGDAESGSGGSIKLAVGRAGSGSGGRVTISAGHNTYQSGGAMSLASGFGPWESYRVVPDYRLPSRLPSPRLASPRLHVA